MARHYRFFLRNPGSFPLLEQQSGIFRLTEDAEPEIVFQLLKVLRIKNGDTVTLLPRGQQPLLEYDFEVIAVSKKAVEMSRKHVRENTNEPGFPLKLWLCVPNKPDKLEFIIQKAVELGVGDIGLFESEFSQMKHQLRSERLQKIVLEAAEQSERAMVPGISINGSLVKFLTSTEKSLLDAVWVAMERASHPSGSGNPFTKADRKKGLTILVGPEGGFSESEKKLFEELGLHTFSLGKRILRMETAAILSLGLAALADS